MKKALISTITLFAVTLIVDRLLAKYDAIIEADYGLPYD